MADRDDADGRRVTDDSSAGDATAALDPEADDPEAAVAVGGSDADDLPSGVVPAGLEIVLVAAVADNGVIGRDGDMPWHYPEDLRHFKRTTLGHPVVMGRRTYESIAARLGGPLPGRTNVVLTRGDPSLPNDVVRAGSVASAISAVAERDDVAFVGGGATVYEQFLPIADRLVLTEVHAAPDGDTHFPEWDRAAWREVSREERGELAFVEYVRR